MAGNDSVNSYLEAILDVGPPMQSVASAEGEKAFQSYSKEVIAGFGETDLHRSWIRVRKFDYCSSFGCLEEVF